MSFRTWRPGGWTRPTRDMEKMTWVSEGMGDRRRERSSDPFSQAPLARALEGDVEEEETIEERQLALVHDGEELVRQLEFPMDLEIGHGHLAAGDERRDTGPETQHDG